MHKMTYTQAATCGENLKVRVTPEQSEKMQRAWFAAGKAWDDDSIEVCETEEDFLYLYDDGYLTAGSSISKFEKHVNTEIELIDDLPQTDFASQQDVWRWVDAGNLVKHIELDSICGFKDGILWYFDDDSYCDVFFDDFQNWKKYTPPRLIRVNGIEVPAPLVSLGGLKTVWIPCASAHEKALGINIESHNPVETKRLLKEGLLYSVREDAIKRSDAMQLFEVV